MERNTKLILIISGIAVIVALGVTWFILRRKQNGSNKPCKPNCVGKKCGESDGCQGTCSGPCEKGVCNDNKQCQCIPDCTNKNCGDDGCGGSCGLCEPGKECVNGKCECVKCSPAFECGMSDGCGRPCGTCKEDEICDFSEDQTSSKCVSKDLIRKRVCGDRQCGMIGSISCGSCSGANDVCTPEGKCVCQRRCGDKECGDDGCGLSCGSCGEGRECQDGRCVCTPDCSNKQCGIDLKCGLSCGTCPPGHKCQLGADGKNVCLKQDEYDRQLCLFENRTCGVNSEGGKCGDCKGNATCNNGKCECACDGNECGPDACGNPDACGKCGPGKMCVNGECVCDQKLPEGAECGRNSCGALVGCGIMKECRNGKCERIPDCQLKNKECGDDGIGGSCGSCKEGQQCVNGKCVCKPECGDRECGDDGCGGSCGKCDYCVEGVCLQRVEHPYRLFPKRVMQGGNAIYSPNGAYALIFFEGTLILNTKPGSFTAGKTKSSRTVARYAAMRKDGNFVVYTDEWYPQWESNTHVPNSHVELTNEGKLLIVDEEGKIVWDNDDEKVDKKNRLI